MKCMGNTNWKPCTKLVVESTASVSKEVYNWFMQLCPWFRLCFIYILHTGINSKFLINVIIHSTSRFAWNAFLIDLVTANSPGTSSALDGIARRSLGAVSRPCKGSLCCPCTGRRESSMQSCCKQINKNT